MTRAFPTSPVRSPARAPAAVSLVAAVAGVLAGCAPGDRPPRLADPLPEAALAFLEPDSSRVLPVTDGAWYRYLWSSRGPWAVHLLEIDASRCALGLEVFPARPTEGRQGGHQTVTGMVEASTRPVLAAVNGDFFSPEGLPLGPEVSSMGVRSSRERPGLAVRPGGAEPWVGTIRIAGDSLVDAGWRLADGEGGVHVVGGFPELLDQGARVGDLEVADRPSFAASRHPRTAVGWAPERARIWIAVVDGRQGEYSTGMSLPELTEMLEALGATEALNLDGGGSSVMVVRGRRVSRPSDEQGERAVVNALALVRDPGLCRFGDRARGGDPGR